MKEIREYGLQPKGCDTILYVPRYARLGGLYFDQGTPFLVFVVNPELSSESRVFRIYSSYEELEEPSSYVGTFIDTNYETPKVFHVVEL